MTGPDDRIRVRLVALGVVIMLMFGTLLTRLWFLQVLAGDDYALRAESNRVRLVAVEAPRGRILDRKGRVLVKNRTAWAVGIRKDDLPDDAGEQAALKRRLAKLLDLRVRDIDARLRDLRTSPYKPTIVKEDVAPEIVFTIRERQDVYPGVETVPVPVRTYPHGKLAAHVLGYVGEVNESELKRYGDEYRLGDTIGRTGVERVYERYLRGRPGLEKLEVDAMGRVLRSLGGQRPVPGMDLQLSIDLDAQKAAEEALREGVQRARQRTFPETGQRFKAPAAGVVVIDPKDGGVVAMASYPTFDPRRFVGGVDAEYWKYLNDPDNHYPLLNRAVQAAYPPGSTYKPITSVAALESGVASTSGSYPCLTAFRFGDRSFRNWRPRNASISIAQALIESCDTPFYTFGVSWWTREQRQIAAGERPNEHLQEWTARFGLGAETGVDLPQESKGAIPGRESRRRYWEANKDTYCKEWRATGSRLMKDLCQNGYLWRGGDAVNMTIGQGDVQATPVQMAVAYAAIANGGKVLEPRLAARVLSPEGETVTRIKPKVRAKLGARRSVLRYVQRALVRVTEEGTGNFPYRGWPFDRWQMASKTGSAELAGKQPFSWFASYGPADDPRYSAVAVVEQAGYGSQVAGPIVRRVMDELFGLPPTPILIGGAAD